MIPKRLLGSMLFININFPVLLVAPRVEKIRASLRETILLSVSERVHQPMTVASLRLQ